MSDDLTPTLLTLTDATTEPEMYLQRSRLGRTRAELAIECFEIDPTSRIK